MTAALIVEELRALGNEGTKKVLLKHGICEPVLGVKVEYLQTIRKRIKKDYQLALDLYDTGIYDAMYLAGLIADERRMTKKDLQSWVKKATSNAICGSTVSWVAAESSHGWDLALERIESRKELIAVTGWSTLSSLVSIREDSDLDVATLRESIARVETEIHNAPNRVRYAMNMFVIAVGTYVQTLTEPAMQAGQRIGKVSVDVGETACKVPFAPDYIDKVRQRGTIGKKRKTCRC